MELVARLSERLHLQVEVLSLGVTRASYVRNVAPDRGKSPRKRVHSGTRLLQATISNKMDSTASRGAF
jgi:hypothetical protein